MHDGTVHGSTVRIAQKEESYVEMVKALIIGSGGHAWVYREGASRALFVVEFSLSFLGSYRMSTPGDYASYARGFFDVEGGVPRDPSKGSYLYFDQKDRAGLRELREMLEQLGIACGRLHRPSARADPACWRFYVSRGAHGRFEKVVGSSHPRKAPILHEMADRTPAARVPTSSQRGPPFGQQKAR